ncbi:DUF507 family protein [Kallotenue papyrolyticum]|uniref:DUF507 family protein n=1 Tax=Kallotenue papyrolyticum TaxID=1325125 RepID=UPI000492BCFD|nr:DUF507 family protein [Kallotenue papyrolyticum]
MKLSEARIDVLSERIVDVLADQQDVLFQASDPRLRQAIREIMIDELTVEERLDAEVRALLEQHRSDIVMGRLNYDEVFRRVKQRLIRERGIVL